MSLDTVREAYRSFQAAGQSAHLELAAACFRFADSRVLAADSNKKLSALGDAIAEIEAALAEFTTDRIGVSRLLGVQGLTLLVENAAEPFPIGAIPVATLRALLPLISRDTSDAGLFYRWKSERIEKEGLKLLAECAAGKHTLASATASRIAILQPSVKPTPVAKVVSGPAAIAAQRIAKALAPIATNQVATADAFGLLVRHGDIKPADLVAAIRGLADSGRTDELKIILRAGRDMLARLSSPVVA